MPLKGVAMIGLLVVACTPLAAARESSPPLEDNSETLYLIGVIA